MNISALVNHSIEKTLDSLRKTNEVNFVLLQVKKSEKSKKKKYIFQATESGVSFYKIKTLSKPSLICKITYFNMECMRYSGSQKQMLTFLAKSNDNKIIFHHQDIPLMISVIYRHMIEVLTESEMPLIQIPELVASLFKPSHNRGINRMRAKFFCDFPIFPKEIDTQYREFLASGKSGISLDRLHLQGTHKLFFDSLKVVPHVTTVILPEAESSHWDLVARFIAQSKYLTELITFENPDHNLEKLYVEANHMTRDSKFRSITFGCHKLGPNEIRIICKFLEKAKIPNLTFTKSLHKYSFVCLCDTLANSENLRKFEIDNIINDLNYQYVFKKLPHLEHFGFKKCKVDIIAFLKDLYFCSPNYKSIDLSGNYLNFYEKGLKILHSLETFSFNNVSFHNDSFRKLFFDIVRSPNHLTLNLKSIRIHKDDWDSFYMSMTRFVIEGNKHNIKEFNFDRNKINPILFPFLDRSEFLTTLSLSGCFNECFNTVTMSNTHDYLIRNAHMPLYVNGPPSNRTEEGLSHIMEFLKCTTTLKELIICGVWEFYLPADIMKAIFEAIKDGNRSIVKINASHNMINDSTLQAIGECVMQCRNIESINLSNCIFDDVKDIMQFMNLIQYRGSPLKLIMPKQELEKMIEEKSITVEEYQRINELWKVIENGNPNYRPPIELMKPPADLKKPDYGIVGLPQNLNNEICFTVEAYDEPEIVSIGIPREIKIKKKKRSNSMRIKKEKSHSSHHHNKVSREVPPLLSSKECSLSSNSTSNVNTITNNTLNCSSLNSEFSSNSQKNMPKNEFTNSNNSYISNTSETLKNDSYQENCMKEPSNPFVSNDDDVLKIHPHRQVSQFSLPPDAFQDFQETFNHQSYENPPICLQLANLREMENNNQV
ncbi:hypothetical protein TRFO_37854 [Tritrichomonas foetus]|uniref:Leucine Rich Repeat family protein n=1 Tax=Tritrichomonas foetus TaxID=1144522 RepID=A0A1J4J9X4_9EUKA|nr:hypothetical protein TRFO_37854 [Tritrichomonas foetus]|eukprot:OHS95990.1 hypothetical protein TRFO_37854 [Tritrichomonas foetus]